MLLGGYSDGYSDGYSELLGRLLGPAIFLKHSLKTVTRTVARTVARSYSEVTRTWAPDSALGQPAPPGPRPCHFVASRPLQAQNRPLAPQSSKQAQSLYDVSRFSRESIRFCQKRNE
eukprot:10641498-Alexandrium_andersonii.AAC.1